MSLDLSIVSLEIKVRQYDNYIYKSISDIITKAYKSVSDRYFSNY